MLVGTFTQGEGRYGLPWLLRYNGVDLQSELSVDWVLGAMSRFVDAPPGVHTFVIYTPVETGDGRCGLTVLGVKR
jgi:hypothetical protein